MTYLFVVIGLSLVNALSNKMSYTEIFVANSIVVAMAYFFRSILESTKTNTKDIFYESLEHIRPEHHELLKTELEHKLGFEILSISLGQIDFKAETVKIKIRYKK